MGRCTVLNIEFNYSTEKFYCSLRCFTLLRLRSLERQANTKFYIVIEYECSYKEVCCSGHRYYSTKQLYCSILLSFIVEVQKGRQTQSFVSLSRMNVLMERCTVLSIICTILQKKYTVLEAVLLYRRIILFLRLCTILKQDLYYSEDRRLF